MDFWVTVKILDYLTHQYPPTLPSSSQGRAAPGTTLGVELCLRSIPCSVHLSHYWLSRLLPSTEASPSAQLPLASWPARPCRVPWLRFRACLPAPSRALSTQRQRRMAFPGLSNQLQRPAALSYGSKTAACPPQNPPTLPCSVQRPFQLISSCLPPSKPSAFSYGSEPPTCRPRNLTSLLWTFHSPFSRFRASLPAPPRAFPASGSGEPFTVLSHVSDPASLHRPMASILMPSTNIELHPQPSSAESMTGKGLSVDPLCHINPQRMGMPWRSGLGHRVASRGISNINKSIESNPPRAHPAPASSSKFARWGLSDRMSKTCHQARFS